MEKPGNASSSAPLRRALTRRGFLAGFAVAALGAVAGCAQQAPAPAATQKPAATAAPAPATTAAASPAATQAPAAKPAAGTIRIGSIYPMSGGLALLGEESWRGAEVARLEQNKKGGIGGKQIEFVKADAPDANAAVSEANRLISSEKLQILIGSYSSTLAQAATEVAERNKVIYWEMGGISDPITDRGFQYLFRTCPMGSSFGIIAANFTKEVLAAKLGLAPDKLKVAVVHEDALYGTTVGTNAEQRVKELGLSFVGREPYSTKATDLSSLILKLKAAQPDVLIATSYIQDLLLFWKQARELDFNVKAAIGTGAGYSLTDFAKGLGEDVNGILNVDFTQYDVSEKFAPGMKQFIQLYQEAFKEPPRSGHSLANYMGAQVLWQVIEKAGGTDPEAVRKAALTIDIQPGTTPTGWGVKFNGPNEKHAGQNTRAEPLVLQWQKNTLVTVWPKEAASAELIMIPWPKWSERKR